MSGSSGYSVETLAHLAAPRNAGTLAHPDGIGAETNPSCGDRTTITLRVADGRVREARFRTFGCTAAIAAASLLTERVTGRTVSDATAIQPGELIAALGGLPAGKEACALLAVRALQAALLDATVRARR